MFLGLAGIIAAGGCAYFVLVLLAAQRFRDRVACGGGRTSGPDISISVLKPLAGEDSGLAANLQSFFDLDYPDFELILAASDSRDPGLAIARSLGARHPSVRWRTVVVGEPTCPNAKVHSLAAMTEVATGDVLVISDSDIRVDPSLLRDLANDFADPSVGAVTCPYRAVAGSSFWSQLEAVGMDTDFWGGVLVAQCLAPMDFAVGPTMAVRRSCLEEVGGWEKVNDFLAEDFQIGRRVRRAGHQIRLGTHVVEHRIGSQRLAENLAHRLRWRRSTRRSRPIGYWGEVFTNPLPWALALPPAASWAEWSWWLCAGCIALRAAAAVAVGKLVLRASLAPGRWWLIPVQDVLGLAVWLAGFFGRRIRWRGRAYTLMRDGRMRPIDR